MRSWEDYVSLVQSIHGHSDQAHWALGDTLRAMVEDYGSDAIGRMAYQLRCSKSLLFKKRQVAECFDVEQRTLGAGEIPLPWTFYEVASHLPPESRQPLLIRAHDEELSIRQFREVIKAGAIRNAEELLEAEVDRIVSRVESWATRYPEHAETAREGLLRRLDKAKPPALS